jgi:two-component system chemotaxis sensor kinase CheA
MERYRKLFLEESRKHLQSVEELLVASEGLGENLDTVFREIHSLKGMAASMGYRAMSDLAHRLEDLLHRWRASDALPPPDAERLVLNVCDRLVEMRADLEGGGSGELDWSDLTPSLDESLPPSDEPDALAVRIGLDPDCGSPAARAYLILLRFREVDPGVRSHPSEAELLQGAAPSQIDLVLHGMGREGVEAVYETLSEVTGLEFPTGEVDEVPAPPALPSSDPSPADPPEKPPSADEEPRLRLPDTVQAPIHLLDEFVDLLGEMTVSRSHLEDTARASGSEILREEVDRLGKLVRDFHARVMSLRMLPFSLITGSLKRLVRQHAGTLGKDVELRISGEEIGMDKSILLQVADPLIHLLRNALDHGLEAPLERQAKGKAPRGNIEIRAARARNNVEIVVADDGAGIDTEAVRRAAVDRGILGKEESRGMSPRDIVSCLFRPGFSTRESVSELSGRGVGLDVVKSHVEALGGTIDVVSTPGRGTEFRLSLPLSVAIIPVLMVEVGESVLAFPTSSVVRTVEAQPRDVRAVDGVHVLPTDQGQVPLLSLARLLRLRGRQRFERVPAVLVPAASGVTALAVDRFLREEDLFIKPLRGPLRSLKGLAGYSVLGDGRLEDPNLPNRFLAAQGADHPVQGPRRSRLELDVQRAVALGKPQVSYVEAQFFEGGQQGVEDARSSFESHFEFHRARVPQVSPATLFPGERNGSPIRRGRALQAVHQEASLLGNTLDLVSLQGDAPGAEPDV